MSRTDFLPVSKRLKGHSACVQGVIECNPGRFISWSDDLRIALWDGVTGHLLSEHDVDWPEISGVLLLSDAHVLIWGPYDKHQLILDTRYGKVVGRWAQGVAGLNSLQMLGNGTVLSTCQDGVLRIHDAISGVCHASREGVMHARTLTDGRIAGWNMGGTVVRVWDEELFERLAVLGMASHTVTGIELLGCGQWLATWGAAHDVLVWDLDTSACVAQLTGHRETTHEERYMIRPIQGVKPLDADSVISWAADETLRVWNFPSASTRHVLHAHESPVLGAMVTPDKKIVSWAMEPVMQIWDTQTGEHLGSMHGHESTVLDAFVLQTGHWLSHSADETLRLWDADTGRCQAVLKGHEDYIHGVLELSNGKLVSWAENGSLLMWTLDD
jgi:WD40 repeat protein